MEKITLNEKSVVEKYQELKNIHKVAKFFNTSVSPVKRVLNSAGFILTNRRYDVNDYFFDNIDNEIKAYWLGFLFADGYIRERKTGNSLELKVSFKDKKHLELFRSHLNSNHKIMEGFNEVKYKNGVSKSHMCHLAIYSVKLVNSIKTQGIHSRKTFTISEPKIEKSLINHFIRGYFDGDGSFSFNSETKKNCTNFACASEQFRVFLINELAKNDIKLNWYGGIKLYIQKKIDNFKFCDYIYKNATVYLERKKNIYDRFKEFYR